MDNFCPESQGQTLEINVSDAKTVDITDAVIIACGFDSSNGIDTLNFNDYINSTDPGTWTDLDGSLVSHNADWSVVGLELVVPGTYSFVYTVTAQAPCVDVTDTLVVKVEECDCDILILSPIGDLCNDDTNVLDLNDYLSTIPDGVPHNGSWTIINGPGGTPLSGSMFDPTQALEGTYTLQFTLDAMDNFCPESQGQTLEINVSDAKTVDITDAVIMACGFDSSNGIDTLNFNDYINSTDPGTWTDLDGSLVSHNIDWSVVGFEFVIPGTYQFEYIVTAAAPCQDVSDILVIEVEECDCDILIINAIEEVCNEDTPVIDLNDYLTSIPLGLSFNGNWSITDGPGGTPLDGSLFDPSRAAGGTYTLTFTHNVQGIWCEPSQSVTIDVTRAPIIGVIADQPNSCLGTELIVELESLIENEDTGGTWTELSSSTGNAFDQINGTFNTIDQVAGVYTFRYYLTAEAPCSDKFIDVEVIINPLPTADAGAPKFGCYGDVVLVGGASSTGDVSYEWKDQNGQIVSTDRTFETSSAGTYILVVTNNITGCIDQDQTEVTIFPDYSGTITGKDLLFNGETEILRVVLTDLDPSLVESFIWYRNGDLIPGQAGDTLLIEEEGQYCVDIVPAGDNESACIIQVCKTVNTVLTKEVYIPNIFSPNNDNNNEIFTVEGGQNVQMIINMSVFERWGELVFQSGSFTLDNNYASGWDGRFKGQEAVQGVYVYLVEVLYTDDTRESVVGDITLMR